MTEHVSGTRSDSSKTVNRRQLLGVGTGLGITLLAGCAGQSGGSAGGDGETTDDDGGTSDDGTTDAGTFRLLISDQPVAIDEFDSLNVSFDRARIFPAGEEGDDSEESEAMNESSDSGSMNETEDDPEMNESEGMNETEDDPEMNESDTGEDESGEDDSDEEAGGFSIIDLDGATVDLTQVVGDKAIGVFEGELSAGRYSKIELYASDVEGIVDGESASVKIPSGKLQLTKPFEVTPDEPVSFVFDINVVKKGNGGYNLLPVISESGVAGQDVEVEEVGGSGDDQAGSDDEEMNGTDGGNETMEGGNQTERTEQTNETSSGDGGNQSRTGGNESSDY